MHKHPLTITIGSMEAEIRIPGLLQSTSFRQVYLGSTEEDRPLIGVGVLARCWPAGVSAPWGDVRGRERETLADLGGRVLEAGYAAGVHPDELCAAGIQLLVAITARVRPPSAEAVDAAEAFSRGPTANGTPSGASSPTDTKDPPSVGSS